MLIEENQVQDIGVHHGYHSTEPDVNIGTLITQPIFQWMTETIEEYKHHPEV